MTQADEFISCCLAVVSGQADWSSSRVISLSLTFSRGGGGGGETFASLEKKQKTGHGILTSDNDRKSQGWKEKRLSKRTKLPVYECTEGKQV
jgi:hypothetical protein